MISLDRLQEIFTLENIESIVQLLVAVFLFFMGINAKVDAFFATRRETKAKTALVQEQEAHAVDNATNEQYLAYITLALNKVILASKLSPADKEQLQNKFVDLQVNLKQGVSETLATAQQLRETATKTAQDTVQTVTEVMDILGNVVK